MTVCIVGLGLMGGSFALSLKNSLKICTIIGYDLNKDHQFQAKNLNLVHHIAKDFDEVKKSDIIILAIPVEAIIKTLKLLEGIDSKTTIIDLGSTKEKISIQTPKSIKKNLILAHPMTGTEKVGPSAAFSTLYRDKIVVLCDLEHSGKHQQTQAIKIFEALSMKISYMKSKEHDSHAAFISHLPHAISFALANSVLKQEDPKSILALSAGGFRDMSRIAKSSPIMWSDIFRQNKTNILTSIEAFNKELTYLEKLIKDEEWEKMQKWMKNANLLHNIL